MVAHGKANGRAPTKVLAVLGKGQNWGLDQKHDLILV
jgi:hypothetical protein